MSSSQRVLLLACPVLLLGLGRSFASDPVTPLGAGSYAAVLPPGAKAPPETIYRTENVKGPTPTNDWWSSLAWMKYSERQYPHPLAVEAGPRGLRLYYPGPAITANKRCDLRRHAGQRRRSGPRPFRPGRVPRRPPGRLQRLVRRRPLRRRRQEHDGFLRPRVAVRLRPVRGRRSALDVSPSRPRSGPATSGVPCSALRSTENTTAYSVPPARPGRASNGKTLTNHAGRQRLLFRRPAARRRRGNARPLQAVRLLPRHRHAAWTGPTIRKPARSRRPTFPHEGA